MPTPTQEAWAREAFHIALHVVNDPLLALVAASQAVIETGWGESIAPNSHNWLNILAVKEQPRTERGFRIFDSPQQCFGAWLYLVNESDHHKKARLYLHESLRAIADATRDMLRETYIEWGKLFVETYCPEDPNYPETLENVALQVDEIIARGGGEGGGARD